MTGSVHKLHEDLPKIERNQYMSAGITLLTIAISVATGAASTAWVLGAAISKSEARIENIVSAIDRDHKETGAQIALIIDAVGRLSVQTAENSTTLRSTGVQITLFGNQLDRERQERTELERRLFVRPK